VRRLFPGSRTVWITSGAVGATFAILALVWCLIPRDFYTGTESITTRAWVASADPGKRLCIPGLELPAGTGRLQIEMVNPFPRTLTLDLHLPGRTIRVSRAVPRDGLRQKVAFAIPKTPAHPQAVPATACLTPTGRAAILGGTQGQYDLPNPTSNGRATTARLAVWYLPPAGDKRSIVERLPDLVDRAALFRPGIVGPWTYVVVLLMVVLLLPYGAVRLLARAAAGEVSVRRAVIVLAALAFANAAAWALVTPAFDAPDEQSHFAYVQYLAETGHVPKQGGSRPVWSTQEATAVAATRTTAYQEFPDGRPRWLHHDERAWERASRGGNLPKDDGGGPTTASVHGPLYYAALVPAYVVTSGASAWTQLTAMRLVSALMGALTVVLVFLTVRELAPRQRVAQVAAALLVGFEPMFAFISGAVNNDVGVNLGAAALLYLLIRGLRRGLDVRTGIALGVVAAALPLVKGTGYALYAVVAIALLGMLVRRHRRSDAPGWAALISSGGAVLVAWAITAPLIGRAFLTTPRGGSPAATTGSAFGEPSAFLSYLWQVFLPPLGFMQRHFVMSEPFWLIYVKRAWAGFGWYALFFPDWVYAIILGAMIATVLLALVALRREWAVVRTRIWELLVIALTPVAVVVGIEIAFFTPGLHGLVPEMGRYTFPAIGALATIAIAPAFAFGRRYVTPILAGLVTGVVGLSVASLLLGFSQYYS
jgi:Predicted membrane protein (DUF2142)